MTTIYNPANWYWRKEDGSIYSSAKRAFVKQDDPAFIIWSLLGQPPTPYPRDEEGRESEEQLEKALNDGLEYSALLQEADRYLTIEGTSDAECPRLTKLAAEQARPVKEMAEIVRKMGSQAHVRRALRPED
ncbi:hypothetical protein QD460_24370 [Rhizobium jaguaris]|uniref:hypothetical protein n=1 Tax=Rhizobium jaguaris TaxID=1312183 RepID=UPI0039BEF1C1